MSGNKYLADTNAFIYLLDKYPVLQPLLESEWMFSFITEIELLGKKDILAEEIKNVRDVLSVCIKVAHVEKINELTISLKQKYRIKLPDALIAATVLYENIPLLTFDKDFVKIKELNLVLLEH
ncbi:MAG TPA: type II toxin-antitoxin system VapC family toxin [Hanamia sp.]|nr:type II toxin-antitoxin system VapC family toxin [Hanamia sp.]